MSGVKICPQCESRYEAELRFCPVDGATLRASEAGSDLIGVVVADRYVVLEKLGEGGMGRVYLAEHVRMGRRSALKVMHPGMMHDADAIARFNLEAANASRISHPNVAAIYDFGETSDGLIYLAMEYIDGEPLTAIVEREGALQPARAAAIAAQVADALAAAHDMGIVHRDLKPDNVMVARGRDDADVVKVVDFGIAKSTDAGTGPQRVTRTGFIVGTPEYMSPEQLAGDPLDGRSDIYALGLVTFHMLTGSLPFPGATVQESMIVRLTERPRTLAEVRTGIPWPADLQAVLDRALAREAGHRHPTSHEFRRELLAAVAHMPELDAADATTRLMQAPIPATRVAEPSPGSPAVSAPSSATRAMQERPASRRRRPLAIYAAVGAAIVVLAAGGYAMTLGAAGDDDGSRLASATDPGSPPATALDSEDVDSRAREPVAPPIDAPAQRSGTSGPSSVAADAPGASARAPSTPPPVSAALDVRAALDALEVPSEELSPERGRAMLARIDALLPSLPTRADSIEALYRRAESHAMLEMQAELCETLDMISGPADVALVSDQLGQQIAELRSLLCAPQGS